MNRRAFIGEDFLAVLESQLGSRRGPTREEFERLELFEILEAFQELWDQLPHYGDAQYRRLIRPGRLVAAYDAVGFLRADGWIEVIGITIDVEGLPEPPGD